MHFPFLFSFLSSFLLSSFLPPSLLSSSFPFLFLLENWRSVGFAIVNLYQPFIPSVSSSCCNKLPEMWWFRAIGICPPSFIGWRSRIRCWWVIFPLMTLGKSLSLTLLVSGGSTHSLVWGLHGPNLCLRPRFVSCHRLIKTPAIVFGIFWGKNTRLGCHFLL